MQHTVYIAGSGTYLPGKPIPFCDIEKILGTLDDVPSKVKRWIDNTRPVMAELLDIKYLHYAIDPVTREFTDDNITMSVKAATHALQDGGISPNDIDLICYGSAHQDQMPTASVRIQEALGIKRCAELSIHANCTSAYKALHLAHMLIKSGTHQNALVISSNVSSSELRAEYYNQALVDRESLFLRWFLCDGAGALVLSSDKGRSKGFEVEHTYIESIGTGKPAHMFNHRPALWINPKEEYEQGLHHLRQQFRNSLSTDVFQDPDGSIFLNGFKRMMASSTETIPLSSIALFQVNLPSKHIAESVRDELLRLGIDSSVFYSKLSEVGYSGPPMVFICLDKILREETVDMRRRVVSFVTEVSKFMQAGYIMRCHED
jgi:3-oxoacyl-[acyl-carrier-protein] synthase III